MKSSKIIGALWAFALIGCGWVLINQGNATLPMDHQSSLSKKDYAKGSLREKDVVQRMTPRLSRELAQQGLKLGDPVFIRIFKESREL